MSLKMTAKRTIGLLISLVLIMSVFSLSAFAAGTDDGKLFVTEKNSARYLGVQETEWRTVFTAADGSGKQFKRYYGVSLNQDEDTDITDLVLLHLTVDKNEDFDIDGNGNTDFKDTAILRLLILGENDF